MRTRPVTSIALVVCCLLALIAIPLLFSEFQRSRQRNHLRAEFLHRVHDRRFDPNTRTMAKQVCEWHPGDTGLAIHRACLDLLFASGQQDYEPSQRQVVLLAADKAAPLGSPDDCRRLFEQAAKVHRLAATVANDGGISPAESKRLGEEGARLRNLLANVPATSDVTILSWLAEVACAIAEAHAIADMRRWQEAIDNVLAAANRSPSAELYFLAASWRAHVAAPKELGLAADSLEELMWKCKQCADGYERALDPRVSAVHPGGRLRAMTAQQLFLMRLMSARLDPTCDEEKLAWDLDRAAEYLANPWTAAEFRMLARGYALWAISTEMDEMQLAVWKNHAASYPRRVESLSRVAQRLLRDWKAEERNLPPGKHTWQGQAKQRLEELGKNVQLAIQIKEADGEVERVSRELRERFAKDVERWYHAESARRLP